MWTYGPSPFLQTRQKRVAISNSVPLYFKAIVIKWVPILRCLPHLLRALLPLASLFQGCVQFCSTCQWWFPPTAAQISPQLLHVTLSPHGPLPRSRPIHYAQPASVSLRLTPSFSGHSVRLLPVFVCCINILWAPWWRVFTAGQTAPAEPPPVSPHACSSVNPLGSLSLSTLSPSLTLSLFLSLSSPALTKYNEPSSFLCCVKEILCFCVRQGCYS